MTYGFMNSAEVAAKEPWERAGLLCGLGMAELVLSVLCVRSAWGAIWTVPPWSRLVPG